MNRMVLTAAVFLGLLLGAGSAEASTRQLILTVPAKTPLPVQIARCAATNGGWAITFADAQGFSSTKQFGEDPANLNMNTKPDGTLLATLNIDMLFGISGNGSYFLNTFVDAFKDCGAVPNAHYLSDDE